VRVPRSDGRSTWSRFLETDEMRGKGWRTWLLASHLLAVTAPFGAVTRWRVGSWGDALLWGAVWVLAVAGSVAFWYAARRTWRRIEVEPVRRDGGG
jgi:hypothetical protein